ncbi:MAG TPA: putative lipid II flippase FtsW [Ktedonobacterales bacterium]|jgi:cell division protein FtsW
MALKTNTKGRDNQPPVIRSPALDNLGQLATPPERRGHAVSVAEEKQRPKARPSGPLNNARETQDEASDAEAEGRIEPLPTPTGRGDYKLLAAVGALLCFSLVMVYSASAAADYSDPSYWFRRQLLWVGLGLVAMFITTSIAYDRWRRISVPILVGSLLLLILVLVVGKKINGGQRWLPIGPFTFQPSELAKLAFTLYIADWLSRKGKQVGSFIYGLVPFAVLTGVVIVLVILQNDMGTAIIIAAFAVAMFFAAGANLLHLLPMMLSGVGAFVFITFGTPYRVSRLEAFLDPLNCASSASYQVCQGLIALGSGGLTGLGLGASRQKAGYLPNPWTDSIFAVIGEEIGFIGCGVILLLIATVTYRAFRAGRRAPEMYGALLAAGISCWIAVQAILNIGSVVALIPFTGVPLPFISFGGSSLVTTMAAVGILLNISRYSAHSSRSGTQNDAGIDFRRRDRGTHLPGAGRRQSAPERL